MGPLLSRYGLAAMRPQSSLAVPAGCADTSVPVNDYVFEVIDGIQIGGEELPVPLYPIYRPAPPSQAQEPFDHALREPQALLSWSIM